MRDFYRMLFDSLTHRQRKKQQTEAVRTLLRYLGAPRELVALCDATANGKGTQEDERYLGELIHYAYRETSYKDGIARPVGVFDRFNKRNREAFVQNPYFDFLVRYFRTFVFDEYLTTVRSTKVRSYM